jgi:HK97 family phage major capsid protein
VSPIRAIAGIRQVSASVYRKPFAVTGAESGWVAETAARPETDSPTLAALSEMSFPTMELYAMPAATSALLDDSAVNIDEWIAEEVRDHNDALDRAAGIGPGAGRRHHRRSRTRSRR